MEITLRLGELGNQIKIQDKLKPDDKYAIFNQLIMCRFSKLVEVISAETGIQKQSLIIIDEKGVDISTMSPDQNFVIEKKLNSMTYFIYDELKNEQELQKLFEENKSKEADLKNISINNGLIEQDILDRYNFKPIYAAVSYIQDLDMTSIQNFEQQYFNDYSFLKQAYKKFKHSITQGFKYLKEIEYQSQSFDVVKRSVPKTFEHLYGYKKDLNRKFIELFDQNQEILKLYTEGLSDLKKYELHQALRKDGKKMLIDVYYEEGQMNKWRDNCVRSNLSLKAKFEKLDKDFQGARLKITERRAADGSLDETKQKELMNKIQAIVQETEPLIISIISTVLEDLKDFHRNLNNLCRSDPKTEDVRSAQNYLQNVDNFKKKIREHENLASSMEDHCRILDKLVDQISQLRIKNAQQISQVNQKDIQLRKALKTMGVSHDTLKTFSDSIVRLDKDFSYLKQPSQLPRVYEKALIEIQRRRRFRKAIDQETDKIQKFIHREKEFRNAFLNETGRQLPSDFLPQLKETAPTFRLEGGAKDYDLPEIEDPDGDGTDDNILSVLDYANIKANPKQSDSEVQRKYVSLLQEMDLLKEEHKSNMKDINIKIDQYESSIQMKGQITKETMNQLNMKEMDIMKLREENEKLVKSLKDQSLQYSNSLKQTDEQLAKKTKEFEALLKSKNCKGCFICTEDCKDKSDQALIKDLNDKLLDRSKYASQLEDQIRKSTILMNQVCQHNFNFLRQKTQDFYKNQTKSKQSYENRIMEIEEQLGLEQKRCQDLIKSRVSVLEDKYQKTLAKEMEATKKLKELTIQFQALEKEQKTYLQKIKDYQAQISKLQGDTSKLQSDKRSLEDENKRLQQKIECKGAEDKSRGNELQKLLEEKSKLEEQFKKETTQLSQQLKQQRDQYEDQIMEKLSQIKRITTHRDQLQDEKQKVEEKFKKDSLILTKQLNELRESSEKEIREKNEKILSLNNMINEHLDKQQEFQDINKVGNEQHEKIKKELAIKSKDLTEVTSILSKRDKEIQSQKQDIEKLKQEIKRLNEQVVNDVSKSQISQAKDSGSHVELEKMKDHIKNLETHYQQQTLKSKDSESTLQRIKEFTCMSFNISNNESWETNLTKLIYANSQESINFMTAMEGVRVLFMPHSPGVYLALVLKNLQDIIQDQVLKDKDMNSLMEQSSIKNSQHVPQVKRLNIKNNLFLDIESMSKNLQTILNNYQMIVIARIKGVSQHKTTESYNPYQLDNEETFFQCQIEKLEHIVGFESDDYSFTDYVCK